MLRASFGRFDLNEKDKLIEDSLAEVSNNPTNIAAFSSDLNFDKNKGGLSCSFCKHSEHVKSECRKFAATNQTK